MPYEKTDWETGDLITATRMNKIEEGIEDAFVALVFTDDGNGNIIISRG